MAEKDTKPTPGQDPEADVPELNPTALAPGSTRLDAERSSVSLSGRGGATVLGQSTPATDSRSR